MDSQNKNVSEENSITVNNQLGFWDVWQSFSLPVPAATRVLVWLALFVGFVFIVQLQPEDEAFWRPFYFSLSVLFAIGGDLLVARSLAQQIGINSSAVLKFGRQGIEATLADGSETKIDWQNVLNIDSRGDGIALKLNVKPSLPIWIPSRNFGQDNSGEKLFGEIVQLRRDALAVRNVNQERTSEEAESSNVAPDSLQWHVDVNYSFKEFLLTQYYLSGPSPVIALFLLIAGLSSKAVFPVLVGLLIIIHPARIAWASYQSQKNQTGRISINRSGLHYQDKVANSVSEIPWLMFTKITMFCNVLILQYADKLCLIVPLRCFESKDKATAFATETKKLWLELGRKNYDFGGAPDGMTASKPQETDNNLHVDVSINLKEVLLLKYFAARYVIGMALLLLFGSIFLHFSIGPLFSVLLIIRPTRNAFSQYKSLKGHEPTVSISSDGFTYFDNVLGYSSLIPWLTFVRITDWNNLLIFEIDDNRQLLVPLRCFESKEKAAQFVSEAKALWRANTVKHINQSQPTPADKTSF